ncbi:hypothetical protein ASPZODRAFT_147780 [Penicilliopsis zonata CBS 506.65]|uniref:Uncharacterized protein n=1 Tax=Penicilliopsis zonata CBS 506.65 TaxID=1073090 RepID=A0A1L9S4I9_9EURO|nr:hypothetical protein ASPZODRAFT_147780 [Penicilliopsis zonata CBS 506.65]OJJ42074.1 hypothetical protein ASPZODRAFT_147780 [Penicilliopsis zonata CBS 506.65]
MNGTKSVRSILAALPMNKKLNGTAPGHAPGLGPPVSGPVPGPAPGPMPAIPGLPMPSFPVLGAPTGPWESRSFDCQKPVRPVLFPEAPEMLPFPVELRDLVAWTDAFVERLGWMALMAHEKTGGSRGIEPDWEKERTDLLAQISGLTSQVHTLNDSNAYLNGECTRLQWELDTANSKLEQAKKDYNVLEQENKKVTADKTQLQMENEKLQKDVEAWHTSYLAMLGELGGDQKIIEQLKEQLAQALQQIQQEHAAQQGIFDQLNVKIAELEAIIKQHEDKIKDADAAARSAEAITAAVRAELQVAIVERNQARAEVQVLRSQLGGLRWQQAQSESKVVLLEQKIVSLTEVSEKLNLQLQETDAKLKASYADTLNAYDHARYHWTVLQQVREAGSWLRRPGDHDRCEDPFPGPGAPVTGPVGGPLPGLLPIGVPGEPPSMPPTGSPRTGGGLFPMPMIQPEPTDPAPRGLPHVPLPPLSVFNNPAPVAAEEQVKPAEPVQPVNPAEPVPAQPEPAPAEKPAEPVEQSTEPTEPAKPNDPVNPVPAPVEKPTEDTKPNEEPAEPAEPAKTPEPVNQPAPEDLPPPQSPVRSSPDSGRQSPDFFRGPGGPGPHGPRFNGPGPHGPEGFHHGPGPHGPGPHGPPGFPHDGPHGPPGFHGPQ